MKRIAFSTAASLLLVATLLGTTLLTASHSNAAANLSTTCGKGNGYKSKVVKGEAAARRAKELRAKNKGVERAMKDLEKKGFRPALEHSLSILGAKDDQTAQFGSSVIRPVSFQSETFTNDGYEMTFIPYDVGNNNVFEAVVYEHDSNMLEYSYEFSVNISGDQSAPTVIEETYYPVDGSAPISSNDPLYNDPSYTPYDPMYDRNPLLETPVSKANSPTHHNVRLAKSAFVQGARRRWQDRLGRWLKCAYGSCTTAGVACALSGPGWLGCFGAWCAGAEVGCVIYSW